MLKRSLVLSLGLVLPLAACGGGNDAAPAGGLAAGIDRLSLCRYADPVARGDHRLPESPVECSLEMQGNRMVVTGLVSDDGDPVLVPVIEVSAPRTVLLTEDIVAPASEPGVEEGLWQNLHALFVVKAPDGADACVSVQNWSPDTGSNSIYVMGSGDTEANEFSLRSSETERRNSLFDMPVVSQGETGIVTMLAREPRAAIASVSFSACEN